MLIGYLALVAMVVWIVQINESIKPQKKQDNRKNVFLFSIGVILTTIVTIDLFRKFFS